MFLHVSGKLLCVFQILIASSDIDSTNWSILFCVRNLHVAFPWLQYNSQTNVAITFIIIGLILSALWFGIQHLDKLWGLMFCLFAEKMGNRIGWNFFHRLNIYWTSTKNLFQTANRFWVIFSINYSSVMEELKNRLVRNIKNMVNSMTSS